MTFDFKVFLVLVFGGIFGFIIFNTRKCFEGYFKLDVKTFLWLLILKFSSFLFPEEFSVFYLLLQANVLRDWLCFWREDKVYPAEYSLQIRDRTQLTNQRPGMAQMTNQRPCVVFVSGPWRQPGSDVSRDHGQRSQAWAAKSHNQVMSINYDDAGSGSWSDNDNSLW